MSPVHINSLLLCIQRVGSAPCCPLFICVVAMFDMLAVLFYEASGNGGNGTGKQKVGNGR